MAVLFAAGHVPDNVRGGVRTKPVRQQPGYVPPGWPVQVHPPGVPDWQHTATAFLLDCCPPDCRLYPVLTRHPLVLAQFAAACLDAQVATCASGLAQCRSSLDDLSSRAIEDAAQAWRQLEMSLRRARREVALVDEALRATVFIRKL